MVALLTAIVLSRETYAATLDEAGPVALFSRGLGSFTVALGIPLAVGTSFAALAISAFALTTLDTSARLGRYAFEELFEGTRHERWLSHRYVATLATVVAGAGLALNEGGTMSIWPVFGAANQMLAALALMTVSAFLSHRAIDNRFVRIPAVVMFVVTLSAIVWLVVQNVRAHNYPLVAVSVVLAGAACYVAALSFRRPTPEAAKPSRTPA
jgi:carbon starvation protein